MFPHLAPLTLADTHHSDTPLDVDMLIGSDFYWQLTTGEIIRGQTGPVAINTKLGWVLSGPVTNNEADDTHTLQIGSSEEQLDKTLKSFWELESFGVEPLEDKSYDHLIHTVELKEGRYEVSLP